MGVEVRYLPVRRLCVKVYSERLRDLGASGIFFVSEMFCHDVARRLKGQVDWLVV